MIKRIFLFIFLLVGALLTIGAFFTSCFSATIEFTSPEIHSLNLDIVQNGEYYGEYIGESKEDITSVSVTVQNHRIVKIEILQHYCSFVGKKAEGIIDDVIAAQNITVDAVTGATWSSLKILKSIENALEKEN